jgi:hypothetical protein
MTISRLALALTLTGLVMSCSVAPRIDRVKEVSGLLASLPKDWKEEAIIVLGDTVEIKFLPGRDNNHISHHQSTWYYVNRRNPALLEQIVVADFQTIEGIPNIQATAYYPGGEAWVMGPMEISRQRYTEEGLYSSNRSVSAFRFPKYTEGMLLHIIIDRNYSSPEFLKSELLRDQYPILARSISLTLPKGSGIKQGWVNPESLQVQTSRSETETEETFRVSGKNLAKLEMGSMPRDPETWLGALHFSLPASGNKSHSWKELGDIYLATIAAAFKPTPELEKLASTLAGKNPDSLTRNIYSLLRSRIRYHADLEILHAYIPRPAGEVLAKGYGDCKEMATLMTTLLRLKGVTAGVALVATPGSAQVVEAYPSMGGFNHMIVYVQAQDGSVRFFDPTVKQGDPFDSYFTLIDRTALLLKDGGSFLQVIPMGPGYQNRVASKSSIRKGTGTQGWNMVGSIRLEGQCAFSLRPILNASKGEEKGPLLKAYLKEMFSVEALDCRVVSETDHAIEVSYEASFNSNYLSMDKGGLLLAWPSLYGGDVRFSSIRVEGSRYVQKFEQNDAWDVPAGFDDFEKSDLEHMLGRGKWSKQGGAIQRSFASEVSVIPPEKQDYMSDYIRLKNRFVRGTIWHR